MYIYTFSMSNENNTYNLIIGYTTWLKKKSYTKLKLVKKTLKVFQNQHE